MFVSDTLLVSSSSPKLELDMKYDNIDGFCNDLLVSSWLPKLGFDLKFDKIKNVCHTLLVSGSLPRLDFDVKSDKSMFFAMLYWFLVGSRDWNLT